MKESETDNLKSDLDFILEGQNEFHLQLRKAISQEVHCEYANSLFT